MYHFTFTITNAKKQFLGSCFFLPEKRSICSIRLFICFKVAKPIMTHMTTEKQTSNVIWRTIASVGVYNTPTQTNTQQTVVFYGLRGLSISVMVLYCTNRNFYRPTPNLHLNLPLTGNFVHFYHTHARTHSPRNYNTDATKVYTRVKRYLFQRVFEWMCNKSSTSVLNKSNKIHCFIV